MITKCYKMKFQCSVGPRRARGSNSKKAPRMAEELELLTTYLAGTRLCVGARVCSLYVPARPGSESGEILLHVGDGEPAPELASRPEALSRLGSLDAATGRARLSALGLDAIPSRVEEAVLLPLHEGSASASSHGEGRRPGTPARRPKDRAGVVEPPCAWLGLRFAEGSGRGIERVESAFREGRPHGADPGFGAWLLAMGASLSRHVREVTAILRDATTNLPERVRFQAILEQAVLEARRQDRPLCLMLVNPDDFGAVNQIYGRERGDSIVAEFAGRLRSLVRRSDPLARYGGVIFAVVLVDTTEETALAVARKIRGGLGAGRYLDGELALEFSLGLAVLSPTVDDADPEELLRRANHALSTAKSQGSGQTVLWRPEIDRLQSDPLDRLSGIFTGRVTKDYRNMGLLWSAIDAMARNRESKPLAREVVGRLFDSFLADRAGLYTGEIGALELVAGLTRQGELASKAPPLETLVLDDHDETTIEKAIRSSASATRVDRIDGVRRRSFATPLLSGERTLGCLFLSGVEEGMAFEASDAPLVEALAAHVAIALDRARLEELSRHSEENERRRLRGELNVLRRAVSQARLIYRSPEMEDFLERTRRAAATDATILVTGESGTGKELLAQTIHEVSDRRAEPFVVVDCGAVATSLLESELFGHERGAYTGAEAKTAGRLAQARRGTVLLDEIGELPLEVQAKLLRFVQERQFTPVGGTKPIRVDVRIVAATNRNLADEVQAGRFREDLYHRLHVVHLRIPALRERSDDILLLARHFFESFIVQYQRPLSRISPGAEAALVAHDWPGNVRELQNRIRQAVILSPGDELSVVDLGLEEAGPTLRASAPRKAADDGSEAADDQGADDLLLELRRHLRRLISNALESGSPLPALGTWLGDDLLVAIFEAAESVSRSAAERAGLPESTFRRRLRKALERTSWSEPPPGWQPVREIFQDLAAEAEPHGELVGAAESILLEEILDRIPRATSKGAALLGVTAPTFRRRREEAASGS